MANFANLLPLLPELIVAIGAMALLMIGVAGRETPASARTIGWLAIVILAIGAIAIARAGAPASLFGGAFIDDAFARFAKLIALAASGIALLLTFDPMTEDKSFKFELPVLVLLATVGMMMMISAGDLMSLYVGLELQSLALYVVAAFQRDNVRSSEAGLKYFVLGALSSGMLLYGASLLYGFAGTTSFAGIAAATKAAGANQSLMLIFGLVFLFVGLAFKISAVPFHMWTPDVYEGAPTPVTAFFASAPKIAAMALMARVVDTAFPGIQLQWQQIVMFLAIASTVLGAFAAIGQTNIKRLMAYSSIANMGYALTALAAGGVDGTQGVLIYLAIYILMTLGSFACILSMRRASGPVEDIRELAGLSQTNLPMAVALAIFMFSMAGIPPMAGFFAKFYAFLPAIKAGLYWLAIVGVVASVVGAFYYLRIVKIMFFDEPKEKFLPTRTNDGIVMAVTALVVLAFVVPFLSSPLVAAAEAAARSLF